MNFFILELNESLDSKTIIDLEIYLRKNFNDEGILIEHKIDHFLVQTDKIETKKSILNQKHVFFQDYKLLASEHGYKNNESYTKDESILIIENIENDLLIVKMYADHLQPGSESEIIGSKLFQNTFYITYDSDLDKQILKTRFEKKPILGGRKIELKESFKTLSVIICLKDDKFKLELPKKESFFEYSFDRNFLLIQFFNEDNLNLFIRSLNGSNLTFEQIYNFDMIKRFFKNENSTGKNEDLKFTPSISINNSVRDPKKSSKKKETNQVENNKINNLLYFKMIATNKSFNLDNIIKMEINNIFYLNECDQMVIGLLNSSQILADLNLYLIKTNHECIIEKLENSLKRIFIRLKNNIHSESEFSLRKRLISNCLIEFYEKNFHFQTLELIDDLRSNIEFSQKLNEHCAFINKRFTAVYIKYENFILYLYGSINSLNKVIKNLANFIINVTNSIPTFKSNQNEALTTSKDNVIKIIFSSNSHIFKKSCSNECFSSQINLNMYPILKKSIQSCCKIYLDFKEDLKSIDYDLIESNSDLFIISKSDNNNIIQINKLLNEYETKKVKEEFIKLDQILQSNAILLETVNNENSLNEIRKIMTVFYKSDQVIHVQLNDNNEFQLYGYSKAVDGFKDYLKLKIDKAINKILKQNQAKLEFTLKISDELKTALFSKFNGIYLSDLIKRLEELNAFAINLDSNSSFQIGCLDKSLKKKNLNMINKVNEWRDRVDHFLKIYFDKAQFVYDTIQIPFYKYDSLASQFLYDKNSLDIKWIDENTIDVFGLKTEIENLKIRIN